ncbi:MAG: DUF4407 domain-containing protein [Bacteroidales bacterium]|nr:DUF4407 domain-containing protein [Bacteroidales bacterium]
MSQIDNNKPKWGGLLNEFLWMCAGINRKILLQCPTDWAKYAGQGGLILFTALMAMLSGSFAFYFIFQDVSWAIVFGIFWGLLIFNLDRFIVNTMYSDGKYTISWGEIGAGLPRLIIAVFIGIVISTPLELKIFEDEINVTIQELKQIKLKEYTQNDQKTLDNLRVQWNELNERPIEDVIAITTEMRNSDTYQELLAKKREIISKQSEVNQLKKTRSGLDPYKDSLNYRQVETQIKVANKELRVLNSQCNQLNSRLAAGDNTYRIAIEKAQAKKDAELTRLQSEIDEKKDMINDSEKKYAEILEKEFGGFKTRMTAYQTMKQNDMTTRIVGLFITLLFIIIEVCPTIFRMMIASGPYDCLLDAERHAKKVSSMKVISDINDDINTEIQISTKKNQERIAQEIRNNKELLQQLSAVQSEILSKAIALWREEELAKVNENPSAYIKTNKQQS